MHVRIEKNQRGGGNHAHPPVTLSVWNTAADNSQQQDQECRRRPPPAPPNLVECAFALDGLSAFTARENAQRRRSAHVIPASRTAPSAARAISQQRPVQQ